MSLADGIIGLTLFEAFLVTGPFFIVFIFPLFFEPLASCMSLADGFIASAPFEAVLATGFVCIFCFFPLFCSTSENNNYNLYTIKPHKKVYHLLFAPRCCVSTFYFNVGYKHIFGFTLELLTS